MDAAGSEQAGAGTQADPRQQNVNQLLEVFPQLERLDAERLVDDNGGAAAFVIDLFEQAMAIVERKSRPSSGGDAGGNNSAGGGPTSTKAAATKSSSSSPATTTATDRNGALSDDCDDGDMGDVGDNGHDSISEDGGLLDEDDDDGHMIDAAMDVDSTAPAKVPRLTTARQADFVRSNPAGVGSLYQEMLQDMLQSSDAAKRVAQLIDVFPQLDPKHVESLVAVYGGSNACMFYLVDQATVAVEEEEADRNTVDTTQQQQSVFSARNAAAASTARKGLWEETFRVKDVDSMVEDLSQVFPQLDCRHLKSIVEAFGGSSAFAVDVFDQAVVAAEEADAEVAAYGHSGDNAAGVNPNVVNNELWDGITKVDETTEKVLLEIGRRHAPGLSRQAGAVIKNAKAQTSGIISEALYRINTGQAVDVAHEVSRMWSVSKDAVVSAVQGKFKSPQEGIMLVDNMFALFGSSGKGASLVPNAGAGVGFTMMGKGRGFRAHEIPAQILDADKLFTLHNRTLDRVFAGGDPARLHVFTAEAVFLRNYECSGRGVVLGRLGAKEIESVDFVENPTVEARFDAKKREFEAAGKPTTEMLMFHGTRSYFVESILQSNFDLDRSVKQAHGPGIYLSEIPAVSMQYGDALLLCRVLVGRGQPHGTVLIPDKYDSLEVHRTALGALAANKKKKVTKPVAINFGPQAGAAAAALSAAAASLDPSPSSSSVPLAAASSMSAAAAAPSPSPSPSPPSATAPGTESPIHVVSDPDQILPYCVYHFRESTTESIF